MVTTTHSDKALRSIDLFAGAGGLSLGLKSAGFSTTLAVELDEVATYTYRSNFPNTKIAQLSIEHVDFTRYEGQIDLVAGQQRAQADHRNMLPQYVRAIREVRPKAFLMENVAGLASPRHRQYLDSI